MPVSRYPNVTRVVPPTRERAPARQRAADAGVDGRGEGLAAEIGEAVHPRQTTADRAAERGERSTWRNGYRDRALDTRLGTLNLEFPKLRTGAYFPGFLEPRKTVEKALVSVIQEA